jgi:hypothetical protein
MLLPCRRPPTRQCSAASTGAHFSHRGVTSTFFRKDDKFWVRTDGSDGKLADFEIRYTFGVLPLQQYLVEFPAEFDPKRSSHERMGLLDSGHS